MENNKKYKVTITETVQTTIWLAAPFAERARDLTEMVHRNDDDPVILEKLGLDTGPVSISCGEVLNREYDVEREEEVEFAR